MHNTILYLTTIRADKLRRILQSKRQQKQYTFYVMYLVDVHNTNTESITDEYDFNNIHI